MATTYQRLLKIDRRQYLNLQLMSANDVHLGLRTQVERRLDLIDAALEKRVEACQRQKSEWLNQQQHEEAEVEATLAALESLCAKQTKLDARQHELASKIRAFATQVRAVSAALLMGGVRRGEVPLQGGSLPAQDKTQTP